MFFYFRIKNNGKASKILGRLENMINPFDRTVEVSGDIQGGLLISHRSSIVILQKAGMNLRVGPGVVIGRTGKGFPQIGNNVYIGANSTVVGNVTIGDNVIIGKNTFTAISDTILFSDKAAWYDAENDTYGYFDDTTNVYENSLAKKRVDAWFEEKIKPNL